MKIVHRPGRNHGNADALSQMVTSDVQCPHYRSGSAIADLPCGGCKYCSKAYQSWGQFEEEVDDVTNLSKTIGKMEVSNEDLDLFSDLDLRTEEIPGEGHSHMTLEHAESSVSQVAPPRLGYKTWDLSTSEIKQLQPKMRTLHFCELGYCKRKNLMKGNCSYQALQPNTTG
ncbi:hypothetical protein DPMN_123585 [Dreissena polymorpha]|uniref:Uncharacterized protein n=1 Tax=Dreissena polymorpha TaxID=45954 RepID=A0A9D4GRW2_DREPO|nr:hypothetical protein DPMN_123585 [Dreissena polymorpha]